MSSIPFHDKPYDYEVFCFPFKDVLIKINHLLIHTLHTHNLNNGHLFNYRQLVRIMLFEHLI